MLTPELFNVYKKLVKYNHLHIIFENKPLPTKLQKDLWVKFFEQKISKRKRKSIYN